MLETVGGRLDVPLPYDKRLMLLNLPPCEASASDIRQRLARGLPVSDLLPEPVLSYIMQKKLYQEGADQTGG
jgi:nicotinate-nucleotide adenylyltransferase